MARNKKQLPKPSMSMHLRLTPTETRIYRTSGGAWTASVPAASKGMTEVVCNGDVEIMSLINRGVLVPDIVSDEEYIVQRAVGSVDYRTYRLQSKIASKYQFSYDISHILRTIENLITLCDYDIFEVVDAWGLQTNGQMLLEIIPREGTITRDHQGNVALTLANETHYISRVCFDDMLSRGVIILKDTKWKLSRKYWEFLL